MISLKQKLVLIAMVALALAGRASAAGELTPQLMKALEDQRMGRATWGQRALLFQNNNVLNQARLNGWITDGHYQAAQSDFARLNQHFAREAANGAGAEFTVQKSKSARYSAGTDSDFITTTHSTYSVTTKSPDPVGQIKEMQVRYNHQVNAFLKRMLEGEGMHFTPHENWHNRLDVDFMADPKYVTKQQFEEIAKLNNDAYKRRSAAEYERVSRAGGNSRVAPHEFRDYALEMRDFIDKKQHKMERFKANPALLLDPREMADLHRMMAQEQKYIERVESTNHTLRKQEGLPSSKRPGLSEPVYEFSYDKKGNAVVRKRSTGSIAEQGAVRSPTNRNTTIAASSVADNSVQRAFRELSESMAEAAKKNPGAWKNVAGDIAQVAEHLPPSEKGLLIERIKQKAGPDIARNVASEMRQQAQLKAPPTKLQQLDNALRHALGVTDDFSQLNGLRRTFNEKAMQALGGLEKLSKLGTGLELLSAGKEAYTYVTALQKAMDPGISDAEADKYFAQAQEAAHNLAIAGTLGAICEAVPTFGAVYGAWTLGYDGTRFIMENTATGQAIDRHMTNFFDRAIGGAERGIDRLRESLGGASERMTREDQLRKMEQTYLNAIKEGRLQLKPGVTTLDVVKHIRAFGTKGLDQLLTPGTGSNGPKGTGQYMVWFNDVGWIHVGTESQFKAVQTKGSETWGGLSKDPMKKSPMLGGKKFATETDALKALAAAIGGQVKRKNAPLAFPKVYYVAGDKMIGFEIVNSAIFKPFVDRANAAK